MDKYLITTLKPIDNIPFKNTTRDPPKQTTQRNTNKKRGGKIGQLKCGGISIAS
jgi:hypothetical protein